MAYSYVNPQRYVLSCTSQFYISLRRLTGRACRARRLACWRHASEASAVRSCRVSAAVNQHQHRSITELTSTVRSYSPHSHTDLPKCTRIDMRIVTETFTPCSCRTPTLHTDDSSPSGTSRDKTVSRQSPHCNNVATPKRHTRHRLPPPPPSPHPVFTDSTHMLKERLQRL